MADKNITIYDVAKTAKTSLTTVSRVLNHPEKVSPETKKKILRVIEQLGFKPNSVAQSLASRKSRTIGIMITDFSRLSIANVFNGIIDVGNTYGYNIKIYPVIHEDDIDSNMEKIVSDQINGFIYVNEELSSKNIVNITQILKANKIPSVFANVSSKDKDISTVHIDYTKATYDLTRKFISRGKKNIYLISTSKKYALNKYKERGYTMAMDEAGMVPLIIKTADEPQIIKDHIIELFSDKKIDAAIITNDYIALAVMNTFRELGMKIPEDIEFAGCQNTIVSQLARPSLTSIDFPMYDIGAVSMRLLTKIMDEGETVDNVCLPFTIIKRNSTTF